ncbi:MAG: dipeptidase [Marinosulfonomonas sp.]|nr:dipeptidase [Marinosulfonomonas sp.]
MFDGHNDVLLKLLIDGGVDAAPSFVLGRDGHIDIPRANIGGFGGGFFALYVPSPYDIVSKEDRYDEMNHPTYALPLPDPVTQQTALPVVMEEIAILLRLQELGALKICHTADDLRGCFASGKMAAIMHMEGAEAIDADLNVLDVLYAAGLRSLGPVWSRPTIFGHGVPFKFPSDGDIGDGLTEAGFRLVKRCNELGIMLDLSHLNEAGFWDVAKHSDAPLVATHSNVHAICNHARNLTDKQLDAIAESDGMVGLNYACAFLRPDGQMQSDVGLEVMLQHLDYLIDRLGEDRVGLGSDFDGAMVPEGITDVAGLNNLRDAMKAHGYNEALMKKLCHENWLRVLDKTWDKNRGKSRQTCKSNNNQSERTKQ